MNLSSRSALSGLLAIALAIPFIQGRLICVAESPLVATPIAWPEQLERDVKFLADDALHGRDSAAASIELAADYIAERFRSLGLETSLYDQTPFQPVKIPLGPQPGDAAKNWAVISGIAASTGDSTRSISLGLDDGLMPSSIGLRSGQAEGDVAFVGYGVTAPELAYDDYEGLDVSGKVVIVLRKEPGPNDAESPFGGKESTRHAWFRTKIDNAIEHGVSAILLVNDRSSRDADIERVDARIEIERRSEQTTTKRLAELPAEADEQRELLEQRLQTIASVLAGLSRERDEAERGLMAIDTGSRGTKSSSSIPVVSIARDVADELLRASLGTSLESLEAQIDTSYRPASQTLGSVHVKLQVEIGSSETTSYNVIASLPGRGPLANQSVVLGAHYDHVGMGGPGSLAPGTYAVHNGADDNASGTATMMAVASRLVDRLANVASHRRIVFIAFTGEERGLLGSKQYCRAPRFSLDQTVAMINLDMVGRLQDNELTVYGVGTATEFPSLVEELNEQLQFSLIQHTTGYGPSDHQSFYQAGVPVLFFFTGVHRDYHRPSDDFEKINFGGMTRITDMVEAVTARLATSESRPAYAATTKHFEIHHQKTAYLGVTLSEQANQVLLSAIVPNSPAERGGLEPGDRVWRIGDRQIQRVSELLEIVRNQSPGDQLELQIMRGDNAINIDVTLEARP